ncbi:ricin B lectin domain-containing protein [Mycena latifolia]|nr:ricin B lectin domain-containing protein [Mycena latifolia]
MQDRTSETPKRYVKCIKRPTSSIHSPPTLLTYDLFCPCRTLGSHPLGHRQRDSELESCLYAFLCFWICGTETDCDLVFNAGIQGCISAADNEDGSPLVIHDCNTEDTANQDWQLSFFTRQNAGPQSITVFGDKCIDVTGGVNADGTKLQIWTCTAGNTNQQWISVTDFTLQWAGTDKCIDLTDGKITDGTPLQIWTCDSSNANQKWVGTSDPDAAQ